jgi:hypothetical protein
VLQLGASGAATFCWSRSRNFLAGSVKKCCKKTIVFHTENFKLNLKITLFVIYLKEPLDDYLSKKNTKFTVYKTITSFDLFSKIYGEHGWSWSWSRS